MIIDAHHHLWQPERGYRWLAAPGLERLRRPYLPADLIAETTAAAIDATVLVEGGRCHTDEVAELLGYAATTPVIARVVAWIDLGAPDVAATLAGYRRLPGGEMLAGVRAQVQGETDPGYLDRPEVRHGLAAVAAEGLAFDLVIRSGQLPAAARAAYAVPELTFVLDHLGKPRVDRGDAGLRAWLGPFTELAACPNVTAKLSGLITEAGPGWTPAALGPFVAAAVDLFGPQRLMFGSDWPVCLLAAGYRDVLDALREALPPLAEPQLAEIFGGTAARVYRIS
ncbi:amidohydrolase family protein [Actinoplanes sp. NPDC049802]|uniref:amidohydrolase family protein n=1 Tax=Actinoplanes sp. NPDC049802 TaxID=3154742 RepID=UPI0033CF654D